MAIYSELMGMGWRMSEIDEMDLHYYLKVLLYRSKKTMGKTGAQPQGVARRAYIDQVWPI